MLILLPKGAKNLADQEFGELTAQSISGVEPGRGVVWVCICSCGSELSVEARKLVSGQVTRCRDCARQRRTALLHEASREARETRVVLPSHTASRFERHWEFYLERMSPQERAIYDDYVGRRERLGITITPRIRAGAVDVAMCDRSHLRAA